MKTVIIAMGENVFLRETLKVFFERGHVLHALILEKGTLRSLPMRDYLKNDSYNPPEMRELIKDRSVPFFAVDNLNGPENIRLLQSLNPDIVILGGSSRILKEDVIRTAKVGVMNAHPGLLPEYRGRDVVGWAIYNGDPIGATCHFVDKEVDTGPILLRRETTYARGETLLEIRVRVMRLAAELMIEAYEGLLRGTITATSQDASRGKTYGAMPPEVITAVEEKPRVR